MTSRPKDPPVSTGHLTRNGALSLTRSNDDATKQADKIQARTGTGKFRNRKGLEKVLPGQTVFLNWKPARS